MEPALQGSHLSHYRENNAPGAAACEGPFEGTKSLLGEGQSNNFLELICGKWRPMGARVGDSTQPAPSTIGESITRQTGVTRKQRSLLGCEKHLLKLLLPLRTVSCFIFPKHREPQVSGKGQQSVFLWQLSPQCLPPILSGPGDSQGQVLCVQQYQERPGRATSNNYRPLWSVQDGAQPCTCSG